MKHWAATLIALLCFFALSAQQRHVTPIDSSEDLRPVTKEELEQLREQNRLRSMRRDSLTIDSLRRDSIEKAAKKTNHPTLYAIQAGVNFWGPLMRALGQNFGEGDVWVALNLKNRFIPTLALGLGSAKCSPDDGNFTYKGKTSFYGKIGLNYNFMYNKDPKYQLYAGLHLGYSSFKYDITDISVANGYWAQDKHFSILNQKSNATWGEFVVGINVELAKHISMGWAVHYNMMFNVKDLPESRPYYVPGYGKRNNNLNVSLSLSYTIPLHQKRKSPTPANPANPATPATSEEDIDVPERPLD